MPRPRTYDDDLRTALLEEAARVMAASGIEGLTLRGVAAAVGTSTSAVYALFGGKEALVEAVVAQADDGFTAAQRSVAASADVLDDLRRLGIAYRDWALAHPALYAVMFGGRIPLPPDQSRQGQSRRPLEDMVRRALAEGVIAGGTHEEIVMSIWGSVHGAVTLEFGCTPATRAERDAAYENHLHAIARGWAARP